MRRTSTLAFSLLLLPALLAAPANAQTPPAAPQVIAQGVSAGGTDLGGPAVATAAQRLYDSQAAILGQPIRVRTGGHRYTLWIRKLHLSYDTGKTARRAYRAGLRAKG